MTKTNPEGHTHAQTYTLTALSRFNASRLDQKEQYSCLYSRAKHKVWLFLNSIHVVGCNNIQCNFTGQHNCDVVN